MRDNISSRKDAILERIKGLRAERLEALTLRDAATAARDRLQAFIDLPDWASLDGSIEAGTIVRFGALTYKARSTHTKALTRSPLNLIYWELHEEVLNGN